MKKKRNILNKKRKIKYYVFALVKTVDKARQQKTQREEWLASSKPMETFSWVVKKILDKCCLQNDVYYLVYWLKIGTEKEYPLT